MASEGASLAVLPGVTIFGTGSQTSVPLGSPFGCWARAVDDNIVVAITARDNDVFFIWLFHFFDWSPPLASLRLVRVIGRPLADGASRRLANSPHSPEASECSII